LGAQAKAANWGYSLITFVGKSYLSYDYKGHLLLVSRAMIFPHHYAMLLAFSKKNKHGRHCCKLHYFSYFA
jgi:hypothetical protein